MRISIGATLIALIGSTMMGGCTTSETPTAASASIPRETVTVTVAAPPTTIRETVRVTVEPETPTGFNPNADVQRFVLESAWDEMAAADRDVLCIGWSMEESRPQLVEDLMAMNDGMYDREVVEDLFETRCP